MPRSLFEQSEGAQPLVREAGGIVAFMLAGPRAVVCR